MLSRGGVTSLWEGDINQFTSGVHERGKLFVCDAGGGGLYLFPRERVGGFHHVTETLVNISL